LDQDGLISKRDGLFQKRNVRCSESIVPCSGRNVLISEHIVPIGNPTVLISNRDVLFFRAKLVIQGSDVGLENRNVAGRTECVALRCGHTGKNK
jgi:hypothetical protein